MAGSGALAGPTGYVTVTPQETTTYVLTAANPAGTRTASVTLTVIPGAPQAQALAVTVPHRTATPVTLAATDLNTPAASLVYSIVEPPAHGALTGAAPARVYTPADGFAGLDRFTYKANDGSADSAPATVTLTVLPAPQPPTAITFSETSLSTALGGGSFAGRLQAADGNPDDRFTFALVAGAGDTDNASFTIVGNQLLAARSLAGDAGRSLSVRLRVTDSAGQSYEQVVSPAGRGRGTAREDQRDQLQPAPQHPARRIHRALQPAADRGRPRRMAACPGRGFRLPGRHHPRARRVSGHRRGSRDHSRRCMG